MNQFQVYLRQEKIKWLNTMRADLLKDTGVELPHGSGFTRSDFCHFLIKDEKKFVHKGALKFVYTNGDTYYEHQKLPESVEVNSDPEQRKRIELKIERMFNFYRTEINNHKLYPPFLYETENFFVFKYFNEKEWSFLESLTREDSAYIAKVFREGNKDKKEIITPFYNQVMNKIMRNTQSGEVVMVDLKILECRPSGPLGILMHDQGKSDYYLLERRFWTRDYILRPYALDYAIQNTRLIKHYQTAPLRWG